MEKTEFTLACHLLENDDELTGTYVDVITDAVAYGMVELADREYDILSM